jgi:RecB family endonuclease NucS
MPNAGVAPAKSLKLAEAVKLKDHGGESWLEKQIKADPRLLGLDAVTVVSTQVTHKGAGRLDLLATDEDENKYVIEIMLGQLDASHVTRSLDYWLREKRREKSDKREPIVVIAAEDIQGSRFYDVLKFLSKAMSLIAIEMKVR